jgi:hypothetical protein
LASALPIGSGRTIGKDIPPTKRKVFSVPFTPEEEAAYQAYWTKNRRVMVLDKTDPANPKYRWNMEKLRKLVMGVSWLGFIVLQAAVTVKGLPRALSAQKRGKLVPMFLEKLAEKKEITDATAVKGLYRGLMAEPDSASSSMIKINNLAGMIRGSPKMRLMLSILRDQVLLHQEKAIVWTFFPGEELYVFAVLQEAGLDCAMLHAQMEHRERAELVKNFMEKPHTSMVLVMSYLVNSAGLNLQRLCRNVHLFSVAMTRATADQAIGRVSRVGQTRCVLVYDYRVPGTFQISLSNRATEKALPGVMTDMSSSLASILEPGKDWIEMNRWVLRNQKLIYLEDGVSKLDTDDQDADHILDAVMRELEGSTVEEAEKTPKKRRNMKKKIKTTLQPVAETELEIDDQAHTEDALAGEELEIDDQVNTADALAEEELEIDDQVNTADALTEEDLEDVIQD